MSFLCTLPVVASLLTSCGPPGPLATGYVEGEYTLVAPVQTAQVLSVPVARGDKVAPGAVLVQMEQKDAQIALAEAEAQLASAQSQLADLEAGARPEEVEVIRATLESARLQAEEATRERDRLVRLADRGVTTSAQKDDAITAAQVAESRVAQVSAELAVALLPARPQALAQAEAAVEAARAGRDRAEWYLEQRTLSLPEAVSVIDILRRDGEIAGPSAPVLSVLGEGAVKLRLYVPEDSYSEIAVGDRLEIGCDGCAAGKYARISFVSDEPEFTPPVIYSLQNRQKLVYLIEARPENALDLQPGQIVDVRLAGGAK